MLIWAIATLIILIGLIATFRVLEMRDGPTADFYSGASMGSLLSLIFFGMSLLVLDGFVQPTTNAYRLGQINAICGKIEYQRVIHNDSTVTWEYIDKEDQ